MHAYARARRKASQISTIRSEKSERGTISGSGSWKEAVDDARAFRESVAPQVSGQGGRSVEIAILVHGRKESGPVRNALLRPFADSSLFEIALEKLSTLDAPCRKLVAVGDREMKQAASQFSGITVARCDAPDAADPKKAYDYLARMSEDWFLVVNPLYPLVAAEQWWEAVENFLAEEPHAWVSAQRIEGSFYNADSTPHGGASPTQSLLRANDAFRIVHKDALLEHGSWAIPGAPPPTPVVMPAMSAWGIHEMEDVTAVEAVYSMSQLGIYA